MKAKPPEERAKPPEERAKPPEERLKTSHAEATLRELPRRPTEPLEEGRTARGARRRWACCRARPLEPATEQPVAGVSQWRTCHDSSRGARPAGRGTAGRAAGLGW